MKKFVLMMLVVVTCTLITGISATAADSIKLKLAHYAEAGHPADKAAKQFAKNVAERTNNAVKIAVYPANQLGSPVDVLEQNIFGAIDMSLPTQGQLSKYSQKFATVMLPFAFDGYEHMYKVLDGPFMDWAGPDLDKEGLIFLSNWDWGFRNITNSVRAINTPDDVKGLKIRTPPEIQLQAAMEALGAQTEQIAFTELITSLSTGAVDGQENPLTVIYHHKLYETQKYLTLTGHVYNSMVNVISKKTWNKLTADQQKIIREESEAAGNYMRELMLAEESDLIEKLKEKGMDVVVPDKRIFAAKMGPAYERISEIYGKENVDKFLKMCEDARNSK